MHGNQNLLWKHNVFNENVVSEDYLEFRLELLIQTNERAPKPRSAQFSAAPAGVVTTIPTVAWCRGTSHVAACPCRRLRAKTVLVGLEAGGSRAGVGKTGPRQR